jgi:hypothetical protein
MMTAIMPIDERRPRGTCMGERVGELFRGWSDARDLGWLRIMNTRCRTRRKIARNNHRMSRL